MGIENYVICEKSNGMAIVTLNRPESLNSLHPRLIEQLLSTLGMLQEDKDCRAVILTGAGKGFCAGGDIQYMDSITDEATVRKYIAAAGSVTAAIMQLDKPVIAMVNGVAAGAGFNLALACDLVFCAASARFSQSFVRIGLVPDCGGIYLLPRAVGLHKARELMFTGDMIDAQTALKLGIVNRVVEDDKLGDETREFAQRLVQAAPLALKMIKRMLLEGLNMDLESVLKMEVDTQTMCFFTEDKLEGVLAFKEKRTPVFTGR